MPVEYISLTIMALFFILAWVPVSIGKWQSFGSTWLVSNRIPIAGKELLPWAARFDRAYNNLKDYFPAFIVAILVLGSLNKFDHVTGWASIIYVIGRMGHYVSYAAGHVPLRAFFYCLGLISNLYLLIKILI